jgi:hypothetical protein
MMSIMALKSNSLHSPNLRRAAAVVCFLSISCLVGSTRAETPKVWSLAISAEPANSADRARSFSLYEVDQNRLHLIGTWWYENGAVGNETPPRVVIEGRRTSDGLFWPDVTSEVKNELTGKWETVAKPSSHGRRATVIIEPNSRNFDLRVNLDVFKQLIVKYKIGRIVLKTGEASEFELKYLTPPERGDNPKESSDKK